MPATSSIAAAIFDMDGVVTHTAELHAAAWKAVFDTVLREYSARTGAPFHPFDIRADYLTYVDGRPRTEGLRSFLGARGIEVPEGDSNDSPELTTLRGLAKRKDSLFEQALRREGAQVYPSTIALIHALRDRGIRTGIVTSSRHGREVLQRAAIESLFDGRIDGIDREALNLRGKPDPDAFLECTRRLGVPAARSVLIEDATAGVEAGRRGSFGLVVGVDRGDNRKALVAHCADVVVADLAELGVEDLEAHLRRRQEAIAWRVEQEGFDPAREHEMESLFIVANGYLGVRGAPDTPLPGSLADLFIAGIFDGKHAELPYSEPEFLTVDRGEHVFSELVSLPFPFRIQLSAAGAPLELHTGAWRAHRRILDLRQGVLETQLFFDTEGRQTTLRTRRCASLANLHLLLQEITIQLENHSSVVEIESSLSLPDLATRHPHLESVPTQLRDASVELMRFRTKVSGLEIAIAARSTLVGHGTDTMKWRVIAACRIPHYGKAASRSRGSGGARYC
jgi:beta-phosphoglucomutase family hydrolase